MDEQSDKEIASKKQRDQMLKLVAKGFYNELINYGVGQPEVIRVASHLLDNLLAKGKRPDKDVGYYNGIFTLASVKVVWAERKRLAFLVDQYIDAIAPSNFLATNPDALKLALD